MKTASQLDKLRRFQRLEYGAVHSGQVKLVFGFHVPSESQTLSLGKPPRQSLENHRRVNRLHPPQREVNGYAPTCWMRGIDGGKLIKGIKLSAVCDKHGSLLDLELAPANTDDRAGATPILPRLTELCIGVEE